MPVPWKKCSGTKCEHRNFKLPQCSLDPNYFSVSDSCLVPEEVTKVIKHCNDFYSLSEEDRTPLNLPGWQPFIGSVDWANFSDLCPAPWNYISQEKLQNSPSWGFFELYDGGGYVADLGYSFDSAVAVISNIHKLGWIDRQTRAVLVEFSIYNPNTGYFSISTFFLEILPTGYGNAFQRIDTLLLTSTQTGFYQFYLICQLLFIVLVFLFVLREVYSIFRKRCNYFRDVWNWIELLQITLSFLVVIFYVIKSKLFLRSALKVKENPFVTVSFRAAINWQDAESGVLAIAVFIATIKLLHMIRFNRHISILMTSLRASKSFMLSYSVIFIIVFLAYAQLGKLVLGNDIQRYSSFTNTLYSELLMCLGGKMGLSDLIRVNRLLGPLFGFSFIFLNAFIFVNFFVAILNDSYEEVKENTDKQCHEDFEMADFILERLSELLGLGSRHHAEKDGHESKGKIPASSSCENNSDELLKQDEPRENPHVSFSTPAFLSHRFRRMAKRKQPRNITLRRESVKKEAQRQIPKIDEKCVDGTSSTVEGQHRLASSIIASDTFHQDQLFMRLESLTSKVVRDYVREDMEFLSLIRLLYIVDHKENAETSSTQETDSTLDDMEVSSFLDSPNMSIYGACVDNWKSSTSGNYSEDEIESLELLRTRASHYKLPDHLRQGKEMQHKLRTRASGSKGRARNTNASNTPIFKYYSFI